MDADGVLVVVDDIALIFWLEPKQNWKKLY